MKLGRACAAGAVLWAVALPMTAGTALADETPAPTTTTEAPTEAPEAPRSDPPVATTTVAEPQVSVVPDGAPETGGGPVEGQPDLVLAGAASAAALTAGGTVLVVRRRRAGAR